MTTREALKMIPVYPESIKIPDNIRMSLDSKYPICEDEKCRLSWISQEAKDSMLNERIPKKKFKVKRKKTIEKNKLYDAFGKSKTLREWSEEYDINYHTLNSRIRMYGMTLEEALTRPKQIKADKVRPTIRRWKNDNTPDK